MSEYYGVVPWFNSAEWIEVYEKLVCPSLVAKEEALHSIMVWKARCPSLPAGIESTLSVLAVTLQDARVGDAGDQEILRMAYSSAIMRFVNHMLDLETAKGSTLYQAAKSLDVPDWIIDLRHDTAHNHQLPSLHMLREAAAIALDWLQNRYWSKHKEIIKDYKVGAEVVNLDDGRIGSLMNFYLYLSVCVHSQCKVRNLSDIPDVTLRDSIINDINCFFGNQVDVSNLRTVSLTGLINMLGDQAKGLLKNKNHNVHVNKALLGEDSLFLSEELFNLLGENVLATKLSKHYMQCFESLLTLLHTNDLILDFIIELITITQKEDRETPQRKIAALWISAILKSLSKSKLFLNKMLRSSGEMSLPKKKLEMRQMFQHWFPSERRCPLLLDLQKEVPLQLTDINFIQPIISAYNPYLHYFVRDLLHNLNPNLPNEISNRIVSLAELIGNPSKGFGSSTKIYTVADIKSEHHYAAVENDNDSDCVEIVEEPLDESMSDNENEVSSDIWQLAPKNHPWSSCALGLLPWQQFDNNVL